MGGLLQTQVLGNKYLLATVLRELPWEVHTRTIYDNWTGWGELEAVAILSHQGARLKPYRAGSQVSKAATSVDDDAAQSQLFLYMYVSESHLL